LRETPKAVILVLDSLKESKSTKNGYQIVLEIIQWLRTIDSGMVIIPQINRIKCDLMDNPHPRS